MNHAKACFYQFHFLVSGMPRHDLFQLQSIIVWQKGSLTCSVTQVDNMTSEVVRTVVGDVRPADCGTVLPHEHLSMEYKKCFVESQNQREVCLDSIRLQDIHWIHMNPYSHPFNLSLCDEPWRDICQEVSFFKALGGGTIVDNTVTGISRDLNKLKKISTEAGVHIVAGTGYYLDHTLTEDIKATPIEQLTECIVSDLMVGSVNGIKCGLIGEIGTSWPVTIAEKKNIRAAASAQLGTGAPVMIHPGRYEEAPLEVMRIYLEEGGNAQKCTVAHLDRTLFEKEAFFDLAAFGCYLELDHFGIEVSYYQNNSTKDMPSDAQRINMVRVLLDEGLEEQVLISHDIHTRHRLTKYGGHGLGHILESVVKKMKARGIKEQSINSILQTNPQRWLKFSPTC